MSTIKKLLLFLTGGLLLGLLIIFGVNEHIRIKTSKNITGDINALPPSHTIIILGASVHSNGKLSPILQDRVDTALKLYWNGKGQRFLLSGDNREDDYDEVSAMRNYLLKRNVPNEKIYTDPAGIDTYDSMFRSSSVYEVPSAIVVTQDFHLPRTIFIAQKLGLNYTGFPAINNNYSAEKNIRSREKLANFKAIFEILTNHDPTSGSEKIPVTGKPQLLKK